jgi:hypothetical protein
MPQCNLKSSSRMFPLPVALLTKSLRMGDGSASIAMGLGGRVSRPGNLRPLGEGAERDEALCFSLFRFLILNPFV